MSTYKGRVFLAPSGEWGFKYYVDDVEAGGGAGFATEAEAKAGCREVLEDYGATVDLEVVSYTALSPIS